MNFKLWLESDSQIYYHGTANADKILKEGFKAFTSGFGQRSLKGVAFSPSEEGTWTYARAASYKGNDPAVIHCHLHWKNPIDTRGCDNAYDIWCKIGLDVLKDDEARKFVSQGNRDNAFFLTEYLIELGYDGALLDNTIKQSGDYEVCVFDPKDIEIIRVEKISFPRY